LIPDRFLGEPLLNEAIRSVTHLVLAPDRKSLFFKCFSVFFFVFLAIDLVPIPLPAGPENIQCRSVFIQLIRVLVSSFSSHQVPTSNPFLTHGTVESPAKSFLEQSHCVVK
jgi:hypothetical protein